jgi:DNA mismatch repair protein MutH
VAAETLGLGGGGVALAAAARARIAARASASDRVELHAERSSASIGGSKERDLGDIGPDDRPRIRVLPATPERRYAFPVRPPESIDELLDRARALAGRTLAEIAAELGRDAPSSGLRAKGKAGELVERALGATGGSRAEVDFPGLAVELKTIPLDARGAPIESTYVCRVRVDDAEYAEWATSWVRAKLARVLWVPLLEHGVERGRDRVLGAPVLWSPSIEQSLQLQLDFEEIMGLIGAGRVEDVTARIGVFLQLRPKAADGTPRAIAFDRDGAPVRTVPRGFYLRTSFTRTILQTADM